MKGRAQVNRIDEKGGAWLTAYVPNFSNRGFEDNKATVDVRVYDERLRSEEQLKKYWALIMDIEKYTGEPKLELHKEFKKIYGEIKGMDPKHITLSVIDMTSLREIINLLLDHCMANEIPIDGETGYLLREEYNWFNYLAFTKQCFICGCQHEKRARHVHHVDKVGMGHNRKKIIHVGRRIMILCGIHHNEYHNSGHTRFMDKYKLQMVTLDNKLAKALNIKGKKE